MPSSIRLRLAYSNVVSFGKLKIGRVDGAAVVPVIEPDEHAAGVYRADDAVPASSPRRSVDHTTSEVGLLRSDHWSVPFLGACNVNAILAVAERRA
jgi:hypothetical protein